MFVLLFAKLLGLSFMMWGINMVGYTISFFLGMIVCVLLLAWSNRHDDDSEGGAA